MSLPSLTVSFTNAGSAALRVEASGRNHTAAASIRIRRLAFVRVNELPLVVALADTIPALIISTVLAGTAVDSARSKDVPG
jgi:hypothetical protein